MQHYCQCILHQLSKCIKEEVVYFYDSKISRKLRWLHWKSVQLEYFRSQAVIGKNMGTINVRVRL